MRSTDPFRQEHAQLLEHIEHIAAAARELPGLSADDRSVLRSRILGFLHGILIPHAKAEELCSTPSGPSSSASPTRPHR